jgi:hypothetical protein
MLIYGERWSLQATTENAAGVHHAQEVLADCIAWEYHICIRF